MVLRLSALYLKLKPGFYAIIRNCLDRGLDFWRTIERYRIIIAITIAACSRSEPAQSRIVSKGFHLDCLNTTFYSGTSI